MLQTAQNQVQAFLDELQHAKTAALLIEYEGVIERCALNTYGNGPRAPIVNHLKDLATSGKTRVSILTERACSDLWHLFPTTPRPEIWGTSGVERLRSDGSYQIAPFEGDLLNQLAAAESWLDAEGLSRLVTLTPTGVHVTWSGLPEREAHEARICAVRVLEHFSGPGTTLVEHEDGLEVRIRYSSSDHVLGRLLNELPSNIPFTYIGSTVTNTRVCQMLSGRGLTIQVDPFLRSSHADVLLCQCSELEWFLSEWISAQRGVS